MLPFLLASLIFKAEPAIAVTDVSVIRPGSNEVARDQTVVTRGHKIVSIGPSTRVKIPSGAQVVDGKGKFMVPGLWDMHVHLFDQKSLGLFTANGVTGIRVMFGFPSFLEWRKETEEGTIIGPRLLVGSPIVDGPKPVWQGSITVSNEVEAKAAVDKIKADGYDFVKVYSLLSNKDYHAIAKEAKAKKIAFAGHVPHSVGLSEAAIAGQATSEHMMGLSVAGSTKEAEIRAKFEQAAPEGITKLSEVSQQVAAETIASFDQKKFDGVISDLGRRKFWQCPTLVVLKSIAFLDEAKMDDPRLKYMSPLVTSSWDPSKDFRFKNRTKEDWKTAKENFKKTMVSLRAMLAKGVPILAGTDCLNPFVYPGFSLADELMLLVEAGMSPTDALAAATVNPAKFLKEEKSIGTITVGKRADFVLLDADPLKDIANVKRVFGVAQNGRYFDRAALDALLKSAANPGSDGRTEYLKGLGHDGD